jgi:hypothetical protein
VLVQQKAMLRNIPIIEVAYPYIQQNIHHQTQVEQSEVQPILLFSYQILNFTVDTQYPKWLDKEVQK